MTEELNERSRRAVGTTMLTCAIVAAFVAMSILAAAGVWWWRRSPRDVRPGSRSLRTIVDAQQRFRSEDLDHDGVTDYGTLAELSNAGLIDATLASGEKHGYRFAVAPSASSPEFRWMAVANPIWPDVDDRGFAVNQTGNIGYRHGPVDLDPDAVLPRDLQALSGEPMETGQ